jgi:hypothetical protein
VHVCAWEESRLHEGIDAVVDELRALEAHHGCLCELARHEAIGGAGGGIVGGEREGQGKEGELHCAGVVWNNGRSTRLPNKQVIQKYHNAESER